MREQTGGVIRVHIHRADCKTRHSWNNQGVRWHTKQYDVLLQYYAEDYSARVGYRVHQG